MEQILKEIDGVLEASRKDMIVAIAFLHGMKTAIMLGLNKDGEENEGITKV